MKKYVKIYMDYHDYVIDDVILCEHCSKIAVDIHHIEPRGIGGDPRGHKNQIENLIALCRSCHIKAETDKQFNNQLKQLNKYKHNHKYE
jgi:5-methylcytosine-specific restriction endonuclease McrA|tara:strand:- start:212 stop:478 length:267 start_codon:yes stop_codon:yes gene_type:complete